jgi:hypothetical protein
MRSGGIGESEQRFIKGVAELPHHPAQRLYAQSEWIADLHLDIEGWLYVVTVLRCGTVLGNLCYGDVFRGCFAG